MRVSTLLALASALGGGAIRILQTNDDGWAELYLRSLNDALNAAGHNVVLSAPADNQSGTSSNDATPKPRTQPCEYNSCPANSGPTGTNSSNPRLNWVNSYPVTSVKYGLSTFGPKIWGANALPDLVLSGPNVGSNVYTSVPNSGTVGAAVYAAHTAQLPSIAFSGASTGNLAWTTRPVPQRSLVYAALATKLTTALIAGGKPYLPAQVWLNVNFPKVDSSCSSVGDFKFVLTRINPGTNSAPDALQCGTRRLPREADVVARSGCYVAVSVGDANDKTTASADKQAVVIQRLGSFFTCL